MLLSVLVCGRSSTKVWADLLHQTGRKTNFTPNPITHPPQNIGSAISTLFVTCKSRPLTIQSTCLSACISARARGFVAAITAICSGYTRNNDGTTDRAMQASIMSFVTPLPKPFIPTNSTVRPRNLESVTTQFHEKKIDNQTKMHLRCLPQMPSPTRDENKYLPLNPLLRQ